MALLRLTRWLAPLALLACGDGLVERGYKGEPLHQFSGQLTSVGGQLTPGLVLRAAIFWSPDGSTDLSDDLVEQDALSVEVAFPGTFTINVFQPPPAAARRTSADYRVGLVLVYEDVNGDGIAQPSERRGGASHTVLLYAERSISARRSPTGRALAPGYHAERVPMPCEEEEHEGGAACGVMLGMACRNDSDCGGPGICVNQDTTHAFWPGGYCAVRAADCPARMVGARSTTINGVADSYLHATCDDADDCRLSDGYQCVGRICLPGEPSALVIEPGFTISRLCAEEEDEGEGDDDDEDSEE